MGRVVARKVAKAAPKRRRKERQPAAERPVARICVDVPLPHLDRPFDYLVPTELAERVVVGGRVRVRFSGQLVDGYVLERVAETDHTGRLSFVERALGSESVVSPEIARLARAIADRYAGTLTDVLRLAVPPRHARAETAAALEPGAPVAASDADEDGWRAYRAATPFLRAIAARRAPRAVWTALPGEDWPARIAAVVATALTGGQGAVVVVPDARDVDLLDAALTRRLGAGHHVALSAAVGPEERYRRFLAARRGAVKVVIGTRAAMFAPVADLGLVVVWDDGDDLHADPRAPYPHAREVLLTRAQLAGAAALVAGYSRTSEGQLLLETGWAKELAADRGTVRARAPRVTPVGDDTQLARDPAAVAARLPSLVWRVARDALASGAPILVQVPRRGYLPVVACATCRARSRCTSCGGPLSLPAADAAAQCRWCGQPAADYACPECGGRRLRAAVTGARRTAEELGRAFPGVPVRTSGRDGVLASVPAEPAVVVTTPGAEPVADGGYGAVLLLDGWALLTRADLRAGEEALRRWLAAAALARPATAGGQVVVLADGGLAPVQALLRDDPAWHASRELAERRALRFPPAVRMASLTGTPAAVDDLVKCAELPDDTEALGPVPLDAATDDEKPTVRLLLRVPRSVGPALAAALHAAAGVRSARKAPDPVRIQIDPLDLL